MDNQNYRCPKCAGAMQTGWVVDRAHGNSAHPAIWIEGEPERGFWGLKLKGRDIRKITAARCLTCGFLEFYAREYGEP